MGSTPYLLRHSATSILAEEGVPPERLSGMLGVINTLPVKEAVPMIRSVTVNHLGYGRWDIRRERQSER
jgi:hypothetical protein